MKKQLEYKLCLLDLLIAIDKDIIDWRGFPNLYPAIHQADVALDLWAGMNLEQIREQTATLLDEIEVDF